jgi:hypothetical protein
MGEAEWMQEMIKGMLTYISGNRPNEVNEKEKI